MSTEMKRSTRRDEDYAIDAVLRTLKVLEALEGTGFEAVTTKRIAQRTGFSYDFCMRALRTLKIGGWAAQTDHGWTVGPRLLHYSDRFNDLCIAILKQEARRTGDPSALQDFANLQSLEQ